MDPIEAHSSGQMPPMPPMRPKNWLVESILVTIFCCLPFGIVGIVYAASVNSKYDAGDNTGAVLASQNAGKWTKIGFWIGLAVIVLYFLFIFVIGVSFLPSLHH